MFKVEIDMSDVEWENKKYKKKYEEWLEGELCGIMEACEDSTACYVNESNNSLSALRTVRDNQTSYEVLDPTYTFPIATIWYQVEVSF